MLSLRSIDCVYSYALAGFVFVCLFVCFLVSILRSFIAILRSGGIAESDPMMTSSAMPIEYDGRLRWQITVGSLSLSAQPHQGNYCVSISESESIQH